ncbi:glucan biosynthesis protein D [Salinisphaera sp. USBA-960]|nr:glucan biosynthesis protein D [Salifodinibacter halophilus]NNC27108.1 glucan biosynthesis protein D [Salifodinibacter halophilus]
MQRRDFLKAILASGAAATPTVRALADSAEHHDGQAFSVDALHKRAQRMAQRAYKPHSEELPSVLQDLSPKQFHQIASKKAGNLWSDQDSTNVVVSFSHVGMAFDTPVRMNVVNPKTERAHRVDFQPGMFDYQDAGIDPAQLKGKKLGFAGFDYAIKKSQSDQPQLASFLGKTYFRAVDKTHQYGLSARGLAIDVNASEDEEFPEFIEHWFVRPADGSAQLTVYSLMDSPSATGIYRFDIDTAEPGVTMKVQSDIYTRKAVNRLGIAPMSSMYLKGSAQPQARDTIYPRMHDSDRLSMWRGNGEWVCRPLYNPPTIQDNAFQDDSPKGFGLVQHDHDFDSYRNTVAWYNRRPSLWIEPQNDWGKGAVTLIEIPTVGETVDNITVFWQPHQTVSAGEHLSYDYKLYWYPLPPVSPSLAEVDQTRTGMGNVPAGVIPGKNPPQDYARRFAIDFKGKPLDQLGDDAEVEANISISRGKLGKVTTRQLGPIGEYRAEFDWQPESASTEPVTMRCYLHSGGQTLTETWLYQWVPPQPGDRHY